MGPGRCCCRVAWAGAHQGLAVAAGDRAQGVALVEVVYEAHAAAQHRAGAQEVGDHLLLADAAVPVRGSRGPQLRGGGEVLSGTTHHQLNPAYWEKPYQIKGHRGTPDVLPSVREREREPDLKSGGCSGSF